MSKRAFVAMAAAALLLSACGGGAAPAKPGSGASPAPAASSPAAPPAAPSAGTSVSIGYPTPSGSFMPLFVAQDEGIFRRNGLDAQLHVLSGGGTETAAMESGSLQIAVVDSPAAMAAMAKGVKTVFVGMEFASVPFQIWAKPSIRTLRDLEGKRLGLQHVGAYSAAATMVILPRLGVDLSKVKLQYLGTPAQAISGLISGKVDAAVSTAPPIFEAKDKGFRLLYDFRKGTHMFQGFVVTRRYARRHEAQVEAFLKSWVQAVAFIDDAANEDRVARDLGAAMRFTNQKILREAYGYYRPMFACDPTVTPADGTDSVAYVTQVLHEKIDLAKVIDSAPARAIEKSGFVAKYCKA